MTFHPATWLAATIFMALVPFSANADWSVTGTAAGPISASATTAADSPHSGMINIACGARRTLAVIFRGRYQNWQAGLGPLFLSIDGSGGLYFPSDGRDMVRIVGNDASRFARNATLAKSFIVLRYRDRDHKFAVTGMGSAIRQVQASCQTGPGQRIVLHREYFPDTEGRSGPRAQGPKVSRPAA